MDATLDIDSIITAIGEVAEVGGVADSIFAHPANITALRLLKDTAGRPLLQPDMQAAGAERIAGATLYATPALSAGTVVVAQSRFIVLAFRRDASVDFSADALFTKDGVAARVTMRVDWGVADPAAFHVIKPVAEPPSAAELDAIATTLAPQNGGVRPTVRVVERLTFGSA